MPKVESRMKLVNVGKNSDCKQVTSTVTMGWCKDFYFKHQNDTQKDVIITSNNNVFHILFTYPNSAHRKITLPLNSTVMDVYKFLRNDYDKDMGDFDVVIVRVKKRLSDYAQDELLTKCGFQQKETLLVQIKF